MKARFLNFRRCAFAISMAVALGRETTFADINWDGDGNQGNFTWSENWYGNSSPAWGFDKGNLVFNYRNNVNQTSLYYDLAWNNINNIIWETTFGTGLTLSGSGNGINFNQKVENLSNHTQTISIPLSGAKNGSGSIELNPVNGDLILNGSISNDSNKSYFVYGENSKLLTINSALAGNASVGFTIAGNSKVKIDSTQSWGDSNHGANIEKGELWIDANGSLASAVNVSLGKSDTNVAKFWISDSNGGKTVSNNIVVNNSSTPSEKTLGGLNTSGVNTFAGSVTLNGQVNLSAATGGTIVFGGIISGTSQNVVINGYGLPLSGVVVMSVANTYSGDTYISGGTLRFDSGASAVNSPNIYLGETYGSQTATLLLGATAGGQNLGNVINARSGSSGVKTISSLATSGTNTLSGNVTLDANLTTTSASGGTLAYSGTEFDLKSQTLTVTGEGNTNISAVVKNSTGSGSLLKTGTGTLTLTASNTYTGGTTVSVGKLLVDGSLSNTGAVSVASAAILGGSGTIGGATTIQAGGIHSAGDVVTLANTSGTGTIDKGTYTTGITYNQDSIFEWNLTANTESGIGTRENDYDAINAASLAKTGTGGIFRVVLNGAQNFSESFWDTNRTWTDIFKNIAGDSNLDIASIFNGTFEYYNASGEVSNVAATQGYFTFGGVGETNKLIWTAVPEPTTALAGLLLGAGLLRRRRSYQR